MSLWKKRLLIALGAIAALALAFSAGRFAAPAKIHTVTVTQTVVKTEIKTVEVEKRVEAKAQVVYVDRIIYKDGTVHEKTETRIAETSTTDHASKTDEKESTKVAAKTEQIVSNDYPRLTVGLLGGYQFKSQVNLIPQLGPFALGLTVQYRIAGPLQVGAFGLSTGAFGIMLGATF